MSSRDHQCQRWDARSTSDGPGTLRSPRPIFAYDFGLKGGSRSVPGERRSRPSHDAPGHPENEQGHEHDQSHDRPYAGESQREMPLECTDEADHPGSPPRTSREPRYASRPEVENRVSGRWLPWPIEHTAVGGMEDAPRDWGFTCPRGVPILPHVTRRGFASRARCNAIDCDAPFLPEGC
jgi:hypothetical protein